MEGAHTLAMKASDLTFVSNTAVFQARGWNAGFEISLIGLHAKLREIDIFSSSVVGKWCICGVVEQCVYGSRACESSSIRSAAAYRSPSSTLNCEFCTVSAAAVCGVSSMGALRLAVKSHLA